MAHDVFISYSSKDHQAAETVYNVLQSQGISCWMASQELIPGIPDWAAAIANAIQSARVFVLIYSAQSNSSPQVLNEIHNADANGLIILPFLIENVPYSSGLEYFLKRRQWLDATIPPIEQHAARLAKTIPSLLAGDVNIANRVLRETPASLQPPEPGDCPYKGLNYFDEADAGLFFGREMLIARLVGNLRDHRFLAVVVGASGSGKSSIVRAGMVPALRKGSPLADKTYPPQGSSQWPIHIITPGAHPLDSLALSLTKESASVTAADTLIQDFKQTPRALHLFMGKTLPGSNPQALLVVDQFEELFTQCQDLSERKAFIDNLITAAALETGGLMRVVITLRADFYAHCADYPNLREAVTQNQQFIGPMTTEELRKAIEEPARQGNWQLEAGLVDLLLREVVGEPGALPLLSHALLETWERREGRWMTVRGYIDSGGVRGAIAHTAETVFSQLSESEQHQARRIFLQLTELGEGTQDTRRRVLLEEIDSKANDLPSSRKLLKKLVDARLITTTETTAEVAHEALIREWPRLRDWLSEDRANLRLQRRISASAQEWQQMQQDEGLLYRGARLAEALEFSQTNPDELDELDQEFIAASRALVQHEADLREAQRQKELETARQLAEAEKQRAAEQAQNVSRLRARNRVIAIVGLVAVIAALLAAGFGVFAGIQKEEAKQQANLALTRQKEAEQLKALADSKAKEAQHQANIALSRQLAAQAEGLPFDQAALLGQQALTVEDTVEAHLAIRKALIEAPIHAYLRGHLSSVTAVAYSPDGTIIASGDEDGTIILWDAKTNQAIGDPILAHANDVRQLAFSPNSHLLASLASDSRVYVWNLAQPEPARYRLSESAIALGVSFSSDGNIIAVANLSEDESGYISFFDAATLQKKGETTRIPDTTIFLASPAFSPDGKTLASYGENNTIILWDTETLQPIGEPMEENSHITALAISPDGSLLASASWDDTIKLWDIATQQQVGAPLRGHIASIYSIAFNSDGSLMASAGFDQSIRIWNPKTHEQIGEALKAHTETINAIAFSSDGKSLVSASSDETIINWNISKFSINNQPLLGHTDSIFGTVFTPDGKTLISCDGDNAIIFWDAVTRQPIGAPLVEHTDFIRGLAISPDGSMLASASGDKSVILWDTATRQPIGAPLLGHTAEVMSVAFSPDGRLLASAGRDQTVRLWDTQTHQQIADPLIVDSHVGIAAVFSPDGKTLVSAGLLSNKLIFWDVAKREQIGQPVPLYSPNANSLVFSPDGSILAVGSESSIILLDAATHQQIGMPLTGHSDDVFAIAFSPDGKTLASASFDRSIILWDVSSHKRIGQPLLGHQDAIYALAFNPEGSQLVSGSGDKTIRFWDVSYLSQNIDVCQMVNRNLSYIEWKQYIPEVPYQQTCPNLPASTSSLDQMITLAHDAQTDKDIPTAQWAYAESLRQSELIDEYLLNNRLCWLGSIDGYAQQVLPTCERAISLANQSQPEIVPMIHDSRGLARALSGDYQGAVEDFKVFVEFTKEIDAYEEYGQKRDAWIEALEAGQNPFDEGTLLELQNE